MDFSRFFICYFYLLYENVYRSPINGLEPVITMLIVEFVRDHLKWSRSNFSVYLLSFLWRYLSSPCSEAWTTNLLFNSLNKWAAVTCRDFQLHTFLFIHLLHQLSFISPRETPGAWGAPNKGNADGAEGTFGKLRARVGYGPAPGPTQKRPCAIHARKVGRASNTPGRLEPATFLVKSRTYKPISLQK